MEDLGSLYLSQPDTEPEFAPLAQFASDTNVAPHQADQTAADGQAKSGSAKPAAGGGVGLGEGIEDVGLLLGRNADPGVAHPKQQGGHAVLL